MATVVYGVGLLVAAEALRWSDADEVGNRRPPLLVRAAARARNGQGAPQTVGQALGKVRSEMGQAWSLLKAAL